MPASKTVTKPATKTTAATAEVTEPVNTANGEGAESAEGTEATEKRTRVQPTKVFELVDELPPAPKRGAAPGSHFGQSKWVKILETLVAEMPEGRWIKLMQYPNPTGAGTAKNALRRALDGVPSKVKDENGNKVDGPVPTNPAPDGGYEFDLQARAAEVNGEQVSFLYVKFTKGEEPSA